MVLFICTATVHGLDVEPPKTRDTSSEQHLRVGVFENRPIVFSLGDGRYGGIAIDVLEHSARQAHWRITYIDAPWAELLRRLDAGELDLLVGMAYTEARARNYRLTQESLIGNWGLLYARPGARVVSPLDLEGKRVAMMRDSVHSAAFVKLLQQFGVKFILIEAADYAAVLKQIDAGNADAGVVNRMFGALNAHHYRVAETGIIFNPVYIHYAAPRTAAHNAIDVLDRNLKALKADRTSVYYHSLAHWLESGERRELSPWLLGAVAVLVIVLVVAVPMAGILRYQVRIKTGELMRKSAQLEQEIDQRRVAQERLNYMAYYDMETGLPNRAAFRVHFEQAMGAADKNGDKVALLFIDLDRLKTINDSLGHGAGDELISRVGQRLQTCLREHDRLNRFGGDEYTVTLVRVAVIDDVQRVVEHMLHSLTEAFDIGSAQIYVTASIGIAIYPDNDRTLAGLLRDADAAMYRAKAQGGNRHEFYREEHTARVRERLGIETRLRHAIARNQLSLVYQPIVTLTDQHVVAVEALLRWRDGDGNSIPPDQFIPVAEDSGLILPIGEWVLHEACSQIKAWEKQGMDGLRVAVNVSSRQVQFDQLARAVEHAIADAGVEPHLLELEVTEGVLLVLTDEVRRSLERLGDIGVRLALDDFGTGYSSLSYLQQLPFDALKIDRSFVQNITTRAGDAQIATTIVAMAKGLGLSVVAEGIETEEQLGFLRNLHCEFGQGYLIARPKTPEDLILWLKQQPRITTKP